MDTPEDDNRWLQGSVLTAEHIQSLAEDGLLPTTWSDDDFVVVLSHSCDIAARNPEAEPVIEVIRGVHIEAILGNYAYGKNPRQLHVHVGPQGAEIAVAFNIHDRHQVPRDHILNREPSDRRFGDENRRLIARWAGKRYWREAFPDAFNERVDDVMDPMRSVMKADPGTKISGLYLVMDHDEELPDEMPYGIDLVATMRKLEYEDSVSRDMAQELLDEFAAVLDSVEGVNLGETILKSEADVSLHDLRVLRRWDYDDLSMREEDPPISPEAPV